MHKVSVQELRGIQLEILDQVDGFCRRHKIKYWIDCGTLLGAVRHKGYIPWDDDIDVGMLRADYDRFMSEFPTKNARYIFRCIENDPSYPFPFGKVLDTDTLMYEPDRKGVKHCINIDIFPYDNAPGSKKDLVKMYRKRDLLKALRLAELGILKPNGNALKRLGIIIIKILVKPFPKNYFSKKIIANSKRYSKAASGYVGDFTSVSKIYCRKDLVSETIDMAFENRRYKAPRGYDKWLEEMYGDYMALPPVEKRGSTHVFEAYSKE